MQTQMIIYRELKLNKKLEVKIFEDQNRFEDFMSEFINKKREYVEQGLFSGLSMYFELSKKNDKAEKMKEEEIIMTPWTSVDVAEIERIEIGGANIGYIR